MYANKNKEKSKSRTVATGADSTRLSSKDSRYDAGDYEAVPESIRKLRDARNRELEEQNALPAEEIIARQEAEIAELKRQAEAAAMTNKYRSVLDKDDEEEHPTFKNPDSMADFGDYEAVASTARFEAAGRDPNQKVFRAKPSVAARKVAAPSDLSPGDYEAVAASARKAVSPDEYLAQQAEAQTAYEEPAESAESAAIETSDNGYMTDAEAASSSSDDVIHSEPYTPPKPAPAPVSAADYAVPEPAPAPAPVSASDYMVHEQPAPAQAAPAPAPAPVSAADYTVQNYTAPARTPAPAASNDNVISREPYTPPAAASSSYSSPAPASSGYSSGSYVPPAQRNKYSDDGNYDVGGSPMYSPTSGKRIASFEDMAPGDYEAVADSSYDDSDMDLADGSYDFDKYLAGAPSLQMHPEPAVSPEEAAWADLPTSAPEDIDDVDITDEQTRALTAAIAQETLNNQPGTQFEDIIDNVIAKVLERKKAEDAAKAAAQQAEQQNQPEQQQPPAEQQNPATPQETEQQAQQPQNPATPQQPETKAEQPEEPAETQEQPEPEKKQGLTPGAIDPSTPIEDIPALIVAELDSAGEVSDDDIRKSIDAALIGKLTTGELTLDSVQNVREKIMGEIHEMQEEEARILAQLEGKPEKHPFDPDFLPADIAIEDIPDAVIAELDNVEGEYSDDDVKQSIDKVMIAKLAKGDLTLDSFQEARNSIFDTLGIETAEEQEEKEEKTEEPESAEEPEVQEEKSEPVEEPEPVVEEEQEPVEEPEPVVEEEQGPAEETEPVAEVEPQAEAELTAEEAEEEPITGPDLEMTQAEEPSTEPEEETVEPVEEEPETPSDEENEHAPESAESPEDEEEEEEQTTPIPVPKEPSVLEYDPYADVFVNPVDTEEPVEDEYVEPDAEAQEETASEDSNVTDENDESEEPETSEEDIEIAGSEEIDEPVEPEDSEELLETPLSAAAVLAMQNQLDEQPGEGLEEEPLVEETAVEAAEPETVPEKPESEPDKEIQVEEPEVETIDEEVESSESEESESEPLEDEEPEEEQVAKPEPAEEEPAAEPEPIEEEQAAEPEPEKYVNDNPVLDNQITFDDILRNPFVDDFEPLEPAEEPVEEQESEESTEESDDEESTEEPVVEASTEEPEDEESTEESVETPEVEESSDEQAESESENTAEPEEEIEEEPESEDAAKPKEEVEEESEETVEPEEEPAPAEEPESEEPDEYAEAKAKRHEDMQNALLMAMIDDKKKTFSDAVNYMINQDELNAKTLRTRMPIDRDTLDRVIKERDFIPDKKTAIAICFALRLTWEDSVRLLYKAGYSLNDTQRYDLTIEYLMRRGVYDQNMINSVLMGSGLEGFGIPQSEI